MQQNQCYEHTKNIHIASIANRAIQNVVQKSASSKTERRRRGRVGNNNICSPLPSCIGIGNCGEYEYHDNIDEDESSTKDESTLTDSYSALPRGGRKISEDNTTATTNKDNDDVQTRGGDCTKGGGDCAPWSATKTIQWVDDIIPSLCTPVAPVGVTPDCRLCFCPNPNTNNSDNDAADAAATATPLSSCTQGCTSCIEEHYHPNERERQRKYQDYYHTKGFHCPPTPTPPPTDGISNYSDNDENIEFDIAIEVVEQNDDIDNYSSSYTNATITTTSTTPRRRSSSLLSPRDEEEECSATLNTLATTALKKQCCNTNNNNRIVKVLSYICEPLLSGDIFNTKYCGTTTTTTINTTNSSNNEKKEEERICCPTTMIIRCPTTTSTNNCGGNNMTNCNPFVDDDDIINDIIVVDDNENNKNVYRQDQQQQEENAGQQQRENKKNGTLTNDSRDTMPTTKTENNNKVVATTDSPNRVDVDLYYREVVEGVENNEEPNNNNDDDGALIPTTSIPHSFSPIEEEDDDDDKVTTITNLTNMSPTQQTTDTTNPNDVTMPTSNIASMMKSIGSPYHLDDDDDDDDDDDIVEDSHQEGNGRIGIASLIPLSLILSTYSADDDDSSSCNDNHSDEEDDDDACSNNTMEEQWKIMTQTNTIINSMSSSSSNDTDTTEKKKKNLTQMLMESNLVFNSSTTMDTQDLMPKASTQANVINDIDVGGQVAPAVKMEEGKQQSPALANDSEMITSNMKEEQKEMKPADDNTDSCQKKVSVDTTAIDDKKRKEQQPLPPPTPQPTATIWNNDKLKWAKMKRRKERLRTKTAATTAT